MCHSYLGTLKSYVHNICYPEGSIAQWCLAEECLTFCSRYLNDVETKSSRPIRNYDGNESSSSQPFGRDK